MHCYEKLNLYKTENLQIIVSSSCPTLSISSAYVEWSSDLLLADGAFIIIHRKINHRQFLYLCYKLLTKSGKRFQASQLRFSFFYNYFGFSLWGITSAPATAVASSSSPSSFTVIVLSPFPFMRSATPSG